MEAAAGLVVLAQGGSWDRRFQATSLAASAAALGQRVDLVLFFAALAAWFEGRWDALDPAPPVPAERLATSGLPPLSELLADGRARGQVRVWACTTSARLLGFDQAAVQAKVDVLAGWPTFVRLIGEAGRVVTF